MKLNRSLGSLFVVAAFGLSVQTAFADYRVELDGSYAEVNGSDFDPENLNLSAQWFFAPVDTSAGPLAEAEFLSRASSLGYTFDRVENNSFTGIFADPPTANDRSGRQATRNHQLRLRYVFPTSGWIVSARGDVTDPPEPATFNTAAQDVSVDTDQYGVALGIGRYLNKFTSLELFANYSDSNTDSTVTLDCIALLITDPGCERIEGGSDSQVESLGASAVLRRVGKIGRYVFSTRARLSYSEVKSKFLSRSFEVVGDTTVAPILGSMPESRFSSSSDNWNLLLAGSWFPRADLGVDLDYSFNSSGNFDSHTVGTGIGWFITPQVEVRGSYAVSFFDDGLDNTRQWRATVRSRF